MKIGIDWRSITKDIRGIGRYTIQITKFLIEKRKRIFIQIEKIEAVG